MMTMIKSARLIVAVLASLLMPAAARAAEPVDLLLVLSADISRSLDQAKFQLQRDGYAAALSSPRVLQAIMSGPHRKIAICFVEWSGSTAQKLVIDWAVISDETSAKNFAAAVVEAPRAFFDRTSISGGIDFAMTQLERAPYTAERRIIDISGDGTHNSGRDVRQARDEALAKGVIINGIVILTERPMPWNPEHTNPPGGLQKYYENNVIGGPGSFAMAAENFESFGRAMTQKLIAEIAALPPPHRAASLGSGFAPAP
jgi:hypothetical protein